LAKQNHKLLENYYSQLDYIKENAKKVSQADDPNKDTSREIPFWKLVLLTINKEGDNYQGVSRF
jgi:hypothetical protein